MNVVPVKYDETKDWLLNVHYMKRMPPMNYAFGLFDEGKCLGIVTFGVPASPNLCEGICGKEWKYHVFELNRMCFVEPIKNGPSRLVSGAIKMLPKPMIIVSYADTEYGHVGKVYQACNFIYTGLSAKRNNYVDGTDRHDRKIQKTDQMEERSRKHRYVYINANKREKKIIMSALKYPVEGYPQGTPQRYEINHKPMTQGSLL